MSISFAIPSATPEEVRNDLIARREVALLDVREESFHALAHPLFAANLPLSRLELEAYTRLPRKAAPIVVFDHHEGLAEIAANRLLSLGYSDVKLLQGGLEGWRNAGYEIFIDVNAPSKAFGEFVEDHRHTPSLSAEEVKGLIDANADAVIFDVRRFEEFHTMSIPGAISVPGGELVLRARTLAPDPKTRIIVNCAGRTRGIIGTQSLINAGLPNPVAALRNGTIGWTLARQPLDHGATSRFRETSPSVREVSSVTARHLADLAGVRRGSLTSVQDWLSEQQHTVYLFDVRTPEEYVASHLPGFQNAPGGQLVQETDIFAPVRGARIVLADDDGTRANMTGSWLAQMGWQVYVLDGLTSDDFSESGPWQNRYPSIPPITPEAVLSATQLEKKLSDAATVVLLDFSTSREYAKSHIPGAWFALRPRLSEAFQRTNHASSYVLTSSDGVAALFAFSEAVRLTSTPVFLLSGGNAAWAASNDSLSDEQPLYASQPIDRYRRPYEGTDISHEAMQAYLDWEYELVAQLERDGTHGFFVL